MEDILDIDDGTWIGLQVGGYYGDGLYYYVNGSTQNFRAMPRCTWPKVLV